MLMTADQDTVFDLITAHLKAGKSIKSLGDMIQLGAAELILRTTVPRQFTNGQHPFDYCNVANNWLRTTDNPYQARMLYLMANFINDVAHENKLQTPVIDEEAAEFDFSGKSPAALLGELDEAIMALDARGRPRWPTHICAPGRIAGPIWRRSRSPPAASKTIRTTRRSRFRPSRSTGTTRRICATGCCSRRRVLLAGWVKMPGERDCFARFEKEWIYN